MRLRTVRAKLITIVALPVLIMMVALPVLWWQLRGELLDEATNRVDDAEESFQLDLDEDLASLRVAARVLATDPATASALHARNTEQAGHLAKVFSESFTDIDILLADAQGNVVASVGPSRPPATLAQIPELGFDGHGAEFHGLVEHGCERRDGSAGPPARVIALGVHDGGMVVVCEPLDRRHVDGIARQLGLEIALLDAARADPLIETTARFPRTLLARSTRVPTLGSDGAHTWALARFEPRVEPGAHGRLTVVAAVDASNEQSAVYRQGLLGLILLLAAGVLSVIVGTRLSVVMSGALARVTSALGRMRQHDYAHVVPVATGDELEDLAHGFNTMVDGLKERDKLRTTFGKYLTATVVNHLMSGKISLGGETLTVTILFSDIRGFTSFSEKMGAQALVSLLNEYFSEMVSIVMSHDGVVDKYIGDAIMAVFGAPVSKPDDALNAVRAAVKMREALARLNERLKERGQEPLRTGIGLHTGEVVAGNIGSEERMEYTVIGDAVNLASRLEGQTKELNVDVLVSQATYDLVKDVVEAKPVKEVVVKGRAEPVMTYEILRMRDTDETETDDA